MTGIDVSEGEFATEVLARSAQVPVVVDFWAAWCAPCRALGPTLEREVAALGSRVVLKKVDVDQAQGLSQQFGVQGIPAVMAFRHGEVVAQFVGAKDAGFVRKWLAELAPSASLVKLEAAKSEADVLALLDDAEVGPEAAVRLARFKLQRGEFDAAVQVLARVPSSVSVAVSVKATRLRKLATEAAESAREVGEVAGRYAAACGFAAREDFELALEAFLDVVQRDRRYRDDGARKAMLEVFEELGPHHALTAKYRRKLMMAL